MHGPTHVPQVQGLAAWLLVGSPEPCVYHVSPKISVLAPFWGLNLMWYYKLKKKKCPGKESWTSLKDMVNFTGQVEDEKASRSGKQGPGPMWVLVWAQVPHIDGNASSGWSYPLDIDRKYQWGHSKAWGSLGTDKETCLPRYCGVASSFLYYK